MSSTGTTQHQRVAKAEQVLLDLILAHQAHRHRVRVVNHAAVAAPVRHLARVERAGQAHVESVI